MGNTTAAGHVLAATGLPQAVGFHKALGQMMYQYSIQPWDPKPLLQASLQRQQELQKTSPLRFIQVDDGLRFYGSQMGNTFNQLTGVQGLNRERFVQMSMSLFKMKGLHLPVEEARLFYDIFDSINLYNNAQLSLGELAGGLSSFFGGTNEAKTNAVFDLMAAGKDQIPLATLQEFLKPYIWCMVPPNAEVLRPVLLPHITQEIYNDMSFGQSGYITRTELQRWAQKGQFSQGHVEEQHASMSFTIIDRAALAINIALRVAWREYSEKYELREYGQQTWTQNYGDRPQYATDVGVYRSGVQTGRALTQTAGAAHAAAAPAMTTGAATVFQSVGNTSSQLFQVAGQGVNNLAGWLTTDGVSRRRCDSGASGFERQISSTSSIGGYVTQPQAFGRQVSEMVVQPQVSPPLALVQASPAAPQQVFEAPPPAPQQVFEAPPPQAAAQAVQHSEAAVPNLFANLGQLQPAGTMPRPALGGQQFASPSMTSFQTRAPLPASISMSQPSFQTRGSLPASISMSQPMTMAQPMAYQQGGYAVRR